MSRSDLELVRDALDHIEVLKRHLARGDLADETVADAVSLRLAAAIETIARTSSEFREHWFATDWAVIWATRNRIVHGYATVDRGIIRDTVEQDVPGFEQALRRAIG